MTAFHHSPGFTSRPQRSRHLARLLAVGLGALLLAVAAPAALEAQAGATTGAIIGRVVDADGRPLANARVVATHRGRGTTHQALTDQNGRYLLALLPAGLYDVEANLPPRPPALREQVRVSLGERITIDLEIQPIEVEEVRVGIERGREGRGEGGVVDLVDEEQIRNLPTAGRDFTDFINLSGLVSPQPDVETGGQFSIGGARNSGTNIQVDGADANNSFFGENRGGSLLPFTFSLESIQEFQLITSGYDVEYGRFSGGIVNAVTRGGTNEFQTSAHLFWRDQALTTDNFDDTPVAEFEAYQFGGTLSGPIVRDRLHFFLSGDFQQWNQPTFALDPRRTNMDPSIIQEFQDILVDDYGFDRSFVDGQFGVFTETKDQVNLFGRLDWTINPDHRLIVRANYLDFENQNQRIFFNQARTAGENFFDETVSVVTELNSILTPTIFNTFRFQYSNEKRPRDGHSQLPNMVVTGGEIRTLDGASTSMQFGGENFGISFANLLEEEKFQLSDNLSFQLGDHLLKLGGDVIFTNTFNMFWLNGNGLLQFDDGFESLRNKEPTFFLRFMPDPDNPEPPTGEYGNREWAFYVQDQWQATDRLLLTAGLRYDFNEFRDRGSELTRPEFQQAVEAFGLNSTSVPRDRNNFGPRLSFTYDLTGDESELVRGGVGLFYGRPTGVLHSNVLLTTPDPILAIFCLFPSAEGYAEWDSAETIPSRAEDFESVAFCSEDAPEISVWDADFDDPTTYKANLTYERQLGPRWRGSVGGIFTRTSNLPTVQDANLPEDPQFFTVDGRPVFMSKEDYADAGPQGTDATSVFIDPSIRRLYLHTDQGEARAWNFKVDLQGRPLDNLRVAANYTLNHAYETHQGGITAFGLIFFTPTAANPNQLGGVGDRETGTWGPSNTERRHVFVTNAIWELPADFQASMIYRVQSGNPFTPVVSGDLNGDGEDNDRAFLPDPENPGAGGYAFATPQDLANYQAFLDEHGCLREAVGSIIHRNTCRNPAWHSLDVKLQKGIQLPGRHRIEVVADFFNVLDGLGLGAGEFTTRTNTLFRVTEFDPDTDTFTVETQDFGREIPVGLEPFQFQAQLGVRYRF